MTTSKPISPSVGRQILEIVTAGMYSDPRMIYREFVQNAADSLDAAYESGVLKPGAGRIEISIDGAHRIVRIQDNGLGIPASEVEEKLGSLGNSAKENSRQRGFRGIGRLGGLAHCDLLRFETRSKGAARVSVVEWDGLGLRSAIDASGRRESLADVVRRIATADSRPARADEPAHFFRAEMVNVHRFYTDLLMNVEAVRSYLSQEAPVPFDSEQFAFAGDVDDYLHAVPGFRSYDLRVNDLRVYRPHRKKFSINDSTSDSIKSIKKIEFKGVDGNLLARGWYAETSLLANLPRSCSMRGIRVFQGNISIGDEYALEEIFSERRFATWHIGGIHVSPALRPNARRDGFEETAAYEKFLETANMLGKVLSKQCRDLSKLRADQQSADRRLNTVEKALKVDFFIDEAHKEMALRDLRKMFSTLEAVGTKKDDTGYGTKLKSLQRKLEVLQGEPPFLSEQLDNRKLDRVAPQELLQRICKVILKASQKKNEQPHLLIRQVVEPFLKAR